MNDQYPLSKWAEDNLECYGKRYVQVFCLISLTLSSMMIKSLHGVVVDE